ncbi:MAG: hypothetical protein PHC88_04245 [Terrimicrobiaceae bacterium]|nr:hypothetical protein [Terrimicrobiaceae bacterium]
MGDLTLPNGIYFTGSGGGEKQVPGLGFEKHLAAENWERRWYLGTMRRGDKLCTVQRQHKGPALGEVVTNYAPWQMLFINGELRRWEQAGVSAEDRKATLLAFLNPQRVAVVEAFQAATGREIPGNYLHLDSNKIHVGVIQTRTNRDHQLVGDKFLRTVGAWSVAQARIVEVGAGDPGDGRLAQNLERFAERHGEGVQPLDIRLHAVLDGKFDEMVAAMGDDAVLRYEAAKEHYREWKTKARRESALNTPSSQRIAWDVIRLVSPLFPPQVQATLRLVRTAVQAVQVISVALEAIAPAPPSQPATPTHEINKIL